MSSKSSSLFSDLVDKDTPQIQTMYETVLAQLASTEDKLLELYKNKKIHSEAIKFAVNKSNQHPQNHESSQGELIQLAIEQKKEFNLCLMRRDGLVDRLLVPRHRVVHAMGEFYEKLTGASAPGDATSLAAEMEQFTRFFELQAMLEVYNDERDIQTALHRARVNLLETIKVVNKNDRRLAQLINQHRSQGKKHRTEAGRLKAYLEKVNASPVVPVPEPSAEVNERLLAGEALTMEEFASMLEHGGLTEMDTTITPTSKPKQRGKKSKKSSTARRGQRQTSPSKRD